MTSLRKADALHRLSCLALVFPLTADLLCLLLTGCVTSPGIVPEEGRWFTKRLGLPGCRASLPMSQDDVAEFGERWGFDQTMETDPEWIRLNEMRRPGEELRSIFCNEGEPNFYALIRGNNVVFRYHLPWID
jgi:hypothetical protein